MPISTILCGKTEVSSVYLGSLDDCEYHLFFHVSTYLSRRQIVEGLNLNHCNAKPSVCYFTFNTSLPIKMHVSYTIYHCSLLSQCQTMFQVKSIHWIAGNDVKTTHTHTQGCEALAMRTLSQQPLISRACDLLVHVPVPVLCRAGREKGAPCWYFPIHYGFEHNLER